LTWLFDPQQYLFMFSTFLFFFDADYNGVFGFLSSSSIKAPSFCSTSAS
jgi:hypothetical protein